MAVRVTHGAIKSHFVNRNTLNNFASEGAKYFKEHWSAQSRFGVYRSEAVESILNSVPGLAALLANVQKVLNVESRTVVAVSFAPSDMSAMYTEACIVRLGANFARVQMGSKGGGSVEDALVFHLAPNEDESAAAAA